MSSPAWSSLPFPGIRRRSAFGVYEPKMGLAEFPRPGADDREQRLMAVEMAVENQVWK